MSYEDKIYQIGVESNNTTTFVGTTNTPIEDQNYYFVADTKIPLSNGPESLSAILAIRSYFVNLLKSHNVRLQYVDDDSVLHSAFVFAAFEITDGATIYDAIDFNADLSNKIGKAALVFNDMNNIDHDNEHTIGLFIQTPIPQH